MRVSYSENVYYLLLSVWYEWPKQKQPIIKITSLAAVVFVNASTQAIGLLVVVLVVSRLKMSGDGGLHDTPIQWILA